MTRNEKAIKLISMIDVCDGELHVHTHWGSFDDDTKEALRFAIKGLKSLEAWEKVEKEIDDSILICRESAQNNIWYDGELAGFLQSKDIINGNLSEVSE